MAMVQSSVDCDKPVSETTCPNFSNEEIEAKEGKETCEDSPIPSDNEGSNETKVIELKHQYSKDELMKISLCPLAKKKPSCLEGANNSVPLRCNRRPSESPLLEDVRNKRVIELDRDRETGIVHKRRTPDPRERLKEEKDDIVLSPQRRSFGTGCHVSQSSMPRRSGSPGERDQESHREPTRRIGSGRIIRDQRDRDHREREYGYGGRGMDRDDKDGGNRYGRGRHLPKGRSDERIDEELEPEWFSGGPTSQSETIELIGFDDIPDDGKRPRRGRKNMYPKHNAPTLLEENTKRNSINRSSKSESPPANAAPSITEKIVDKTEKQIEKKDIKEKKQEDDKNEQKDGASASDQKFDFNDIFKADWFPGFLNQNTAPPEQSTAGLGGSRFTQWFKRESPTLGKSEENARRSSMQGQDLMAQVLGGTFPTENKKIYRIGEPHLIIPSPSPPPNSDVYFTPISPALPASHLSPYGQTPEIRHPTPQPMPPKTDGGKEIMDMLKGGSKMEHVLNGTLDHRNHGDGKVRSVEELEAGLKHLVLGNHSKQDDKSAFAKLLNQMQDQNTPTIPTAMSMGPMDHTKALQEEDLLQNLLHNQNSQPNRGPPPAGGTSPIMRRLDSQLNVGQRKENAMNHQDNFGPPQPQDALSQLMNHQGPGGEGLTVDSLARLLGIETLGDKTVPPAPSMLHSNPISHVPKPGSQPFGGHLTQEQQHTISNQFKFQQLGTMQNSSHDQNMLSQNLGIPPNISPCSSPLPDGLSGARVPSPLVFGQQPPVLGHAPSPLHPLQMSQMLSPNSTPSNNSLQVQSPNALPRVPSPQELAAHTQLILQNALIKRKLEEQRENYRRRQEAQAQRSRSPPNVKNSSPPKGLSPTMAAFTPTSVMRKMHTDKNDKDIKNESPNFNMKKMDLSEPSFHFKSMIQNGNMSSLGEARDLQNNGMAGQLDSLLQRGGMGNNIGTSFPPAGAVPITGMNQLRPQVSVNAATAAALAGQGRPIVKSATTNEHPQIPKGVMGRGKPITAANPQSSMMRSELGMGNMDPVVKMLQQQQQQQLQQQQQMNLAAAAAQRQLSTSPMPPNPNTFGIGVRPSGIQSHASARPTKVNVPPAAVGANNIGLAPLLRSMIQVNLNNPSLRAQATSLSQLQQLSQLATLQQLQQQRGTLDPQIQQLLNQARGLNPVALQQLLLNASTNTPAAVAAAQAQAAGIVLPTPVIGRNPGVPGIGGAQVGGTRLDANAAFGAMKAQQLMPGQVMGSRHSPNNLTKWFGNDVLKQKMPDMPPVPMQKAMSVEEVERLQQSAPVHN